MAKGDLLRALLGMKHSPAGKKYLAKKKKETEPTYFRGIKGLRRKTAVQRLRDAGVSEKDLRSLGVK